MTRVERATLSAAGLRTATLAGATAALAFWGAKPFELPRALTWSALRFWLSVHGPMEAGFGAVWLLALVTGAYLTLIAGLSTVGCALRSRLLTRLAAAMALPGCRWVLATGLTASLTLGLTSGVAGAATPAPDPPVMTYLGPATPLAPRGSIPPSASGNIAPARPPAVIAPQAVPSPSPPPDPASSCTLRPGDNLWSVAEATLAAAWGRAPSATETGPFWWDLLQLNRAQLPYPDDPDLVFPGDLVLLPPVPGPPSAAQAG